MNASEEPLRKEPPRSAATETVPTASAAGEPSRDERSSSAGVKRPYEEKRRETPPPSWRNRLRTATPALRRAAALVFSGIAAPALLAFGVRYALDVGQYDLMTNAFLARNHVTAMRWSDDGEVLYAGGEDGTMIVVGADGEWLSGDADLPTLEPRQRDPTMSRNNITVGFIEDVQIFLSIDASEEAQPRLPDYHTTYGPVPGGIAALAARHLVTLAGSAQGDISMSQTQSTDYGRLCSRYP